ncbi:MAG: UDP-2,3-diacylglucosamine diphosphatase [Lautropia sp.]|nr:UDP-2,3-diacylglucosamine diphosphatase [Lautropia sp.]
MNAPAPLIHLDHPAAVLVAADMHLDDRDPALCERFLQALDDRLARTPSTGTALFLLGDLFEYWIGDDTPSPVAEALALRLKAFTEAGGHCFLMHGNRDFLLDAPLTARNPAQPYSKRCGAMLLPDPAVIEVSGQRIVLTHGDLLCTDDVAYQQWRTQCRQPAWQAALLAMPMAERIAMAQSLRTQSQQTQLAADALVDVSASAVDQMLDEHGCERMIHGHTHRPALHQWAGPNGPRRRWVLPDWSAKAPVRGEILSLADSGLLD